MPSNAMKLFMWRDRRRVSDRFHSGGGLVVVARDLEHARELIAEHNDVYQDRWEDRPTIDLTDAECGKVREFPLAEVFLAEPQVIVFPDAGCC